MRTFGRITSEVLQQISPPGIFTILSLFSTYVFVSVFHPSSSHTPTHFLSQKGLRTKAHLAMLAVTTMMYGLAVVHFAIDLSVVVCTFNASCTPSMHQTLGIGPLTVVNVSLSPSVKITNIDDALPVHSERHDRGVARLADLGSGTQHPGHRRLSHNDHAWCAFTGMRGQKSHKLITTFRSAMSIVADHIYTIRAAELTSFLAGVSFGKTPWGLTTLLSGLATNVMSTALIAYKAWYAGNSTYDVTSSNVDASMQGIQALRPFGA